MKQLKIGTFISGSGSNLQAIIDRCADNTINAQILFTVSDNPSAKGLSRASKADIPAFVVDYAQIAANPAPFFPDDCDINDIINKQSLISKDKSPDWLTTYFTAKVAAEAELLRKMSAYDYDLIVLAGFMRTLSPYFIDKINRNSSLPGIMNIHPALLPSFPGTNGYEDTYRYGCKVGGCTVHFIDYGEDSGPIIGQTAFNITPEDTLSSVKEKGLEREWELYPRCINLFAQNRLTLETDPHTHRKVVTVRTKPGDCCW